MTRWAYLGPGHTRQTYYGRLISLRFTFPRSEFTKNISLQSAYPEPRNHAYALKIWLLIHSRNQCHATSLIPLLSLSYLKDQEYRRIMSFNAAKRIWHISYKDPSENRATKFLRSLLGHSKMSWEDEIIAQRVRQTPFRLSLGSSSDATTIFFATYDAFF
jgi:hypothetical protein